MRRRILGVAVLAVLLAVTLLGVPLALAGRALLYADEGSELERLALRGAAAVSADAAAGDPVELPSPENGVQLGIYDPQGRRTAGHGPRRADTAVRGALAGRVTESTTTDRLVAAVPVASGERIVAVARASSSRGVVRRRVAQTWAAMLGLALLATGCAVLLAAAAARRVTRPLEHLVAMARSLGDGTTRIAPAHSGVAELDRAGAALASTGHQLDALVARERAFTGRASHQLRTPLTSLRLGLESALATPGADLAEAGRAAVAAADELARTVDDVLALARGGPAVTTVDLTTVLGDVRSRWHGPLAAAGRPLRTDDSDSPSTAAGSPAAVRQALDVLLDNAMLHGAGVVTVRVRSLDTAVAIDVADEGSTQGHLLVPVAGESAQGADDPPDRHLGLALARSLIEAQGGRLLHARTDPQTRFTLLLPRERT